MPNGKVDEGEIARRKRIWAHFQAFTMENYEKDLTVQEDAWNTT